MEYDLFAQMNRLLELIFEERDAAKALDMHRLTALAQEKEALVGIFTQITEENDEDLHELAEQIRLENRRNAYLFWAGLNMVRDTMEFFGRLVPPPSYDALGTTVSGPRGGRILSGRI